MFNKPTDFLSIAQRLPIDLDYLWDWQVIDSSINSKSQVRMINNHKPWLTEHVQTEGAGAY